MPNLLRSLIVYKIGNNEVVIVQPGNHASGKNGLEYYVLNVQGESFVDLAPGIQLESRVLRGHNHRKSVTRKLVRMQRHWGVGSLKLN